MATRSKALCAMQVKTTALALESETALAIADSGSGIRFFPLLSKIRIRREMQRKHKEQKKKEKKEKEKKGTERRGQTLDTALPPL